MPVIEIGLATAAVAAAGASYLIPLVISCIGGAIVATATFFAGFKMARRKNNADLSGLKKQQYERDKQTKQEAENIVVQTEQDVRDILAQTKKQNAALDQTILDFQEEIDASKKVTGSLEKFTHGVRDLTETGKINLTDMCTELERVNTELIRVTDALKIKEQSLDEKDKLLKNTLDKLTHCEKKASHDALISIQNIQKLQIEISHIYKEFDMIRKTKLLQKEQVDTLMEQNQRLTATINKLEKTILDLSDSLENANIKNDTQCQETQRLLDENKQLALLIEELSHVIESGSVEMKGEPYQSNNASMRLFR